MHEQGIELFESTTNRVRPIMGLGRRVVCKCYDPFAFRNGIRLPRSRALVEAAVLDWLDAELTAHRRHLVVPRPLRLDAHGAFLIMPDLRGIPLSLCSEAEWPPPKAWYSLGVVMARIEHQSDRIASCLPTAVWRDQVSFQRELVGRHINRVTPCQSILMAEYDRSLLEARPVPCLGDLTLPNLIACGDRLGVIDLESTHIGYRGYDVGRLAALLQARAARTTGCPRLLEAYASELLEGFDDEGGALVYANMWGQVLRCYYDNPSYRGPNVPAAA